MKPRPIHANAALMAAVRAEGGMAYQRGASPAAAPYADPLRRDWWLLGYQAAAAAAKAAERAAGEVAA